MSNLIYSLKRLSDSIALNYGTPTASNYIINLEISRDIFTKLQIELLTSQRMYDTDSWFNPEEIQIHCGQHIFKVFPINNNKEE